MLRYAGLQIAERPIKTPVIAVHQSWHERFHNDPAISWLRRLVQQEFKAEKRGVDGTGATAP